MSAYTIKSKLSQKRIGLYEDERARNTALSDLLDQAYRLHYPDDDSRVNYRKVEERRKRLQDALFVITTLVEVDV